MPTLSEYRSKLNAWRAGLEAPYAKAQREGDTAEMARLEGIAGEIDDLLDELAIIGMTRLAEAMTILKAKIEGQTAAVEEAASGIGGLSLEKIREQIAAIFEESAEEELPPEEDGAAADTDTGSADTTEISPETPATPASEETGETEVSEPATAPTPEEAEEPEPAPEEPVVTATEPDLSDTGALVLSEAHLIGLWKRSAFPVDGRGIIVFGLRGCLPVDSAGTGFGAKHEISISQVNYTTMNCTIGQWNPGSGLAVFPGSTVPFQTVVQGGLSRNGVGVNQMGRGRYKNYKAHWHKRSEGSRGHWALVQECAITIQRSADDLDYDLDDRWEVGRIAGDNIHCAFHMGPQGRIPDARFSSAGCQTIAGTVRKGERGSERGPWRRFIEPFLNKLGNQKSTEYVLFDAKEVQQIIKTKYAGKTVILRMGSAGPLVKRLQLALNKQGDSLKVDGDFGPSTFLAVTDFQTSAFGPDADDGIVGPETAQELGFNLPEFDFKDAISGGRGYVLTQAEEQAEAGGGGSASPSFPAPAADIDTSDQIAWGAVTTKKHGVAFKEEVIRIARRLKCDPNHLMAVMAFETGEKFTPDVKNAAGSGATGLIQFMPATARGLGTTTAKLARMSAMEQLKFVEKHFKTAAPRKPLNTLSDVYMAVLLPSTVGKPESHVLFHNPSTAYRQNSGLDADSDGKITKFEAAAKVRSKLNKGLKPKRRG